jgi:glycerate 2-kinase
MPLSDGGDGFLESFPGERRRAVVAGPLGHPVEAEWELVDTGSGAQRTAVIEMAQAAGLDLVGGPERNAPLLATTRGIGELVRAALQCAATTIIVGCGGSATTDGGLGAFEVIDREHLDGITLIAAADVTTTFVRAAEEFGPQKGADATEIAQLTARLDTLAQFYRERTGIDVSSLPGSGAAGGLAGGLAALGARIVPGFDLIAQQVGLAARMERADLIVTGEGRLDRTSFSGKVVGRVLGAAGATPVLIVAGDVDPDARTCAELGEPGVEVVSLTGLFGPERSRLETAELVQSVVGEALDRVRG